MSRNSLGMVTRSKPLPSPVKFIISSSAAVSGRVKPFVFANSTESSSLWACSIGPMSRSRIAAWIPLPASVVLASLSCSFQAFGTVRLNAIIFFSAAILRSIALRSARLALG